MRKVGRGNAERLAPDAWLFFLTRSHWVSVRRVKMTGFGELNCLDPGKRFAMLIGSARALEFIYSPFDTPETASGGVILY